MEIHCYSFTATQNSNEFHILLIFNFFFLISDYSSQFKFLLMNRLVLFQMLPLIMLLTVSAIVAIQQQTGLQRRVQSFFDTPGHTNNWAILVCTSRFWFNYRHVANVLSLYHSVKRLGIPDRLVPCVTFF